MKGALKLIDFGIAKAIESQDTTNVYRETLSGTLSYMSPGKFIVSYSRTKVLLTQAYYHLVYRGADGYKHQCQWRENQQVRKSKLVSSLGLI